MKKKIMDGNEACATVSYHFTEVAGIYPITPSSTMAELTDSWSGSFKKNFWDMPVKVVEMQSEAGAAGMIHGSLQAGSLTTTYTASQGLLLMIPNMYKIAGEKLPLVIHVAARSLATHALSIFGDHQDIYATRMTGFALLASSNPQQVADLTAVAHLSAIDAHLPFLHFFDGFRTSHELNKVEILEEKELKELINEEQLQSFRSRAIQNLQVTRGTAQNDDIYFQMMESRNKDYEDLPFIVESYMQKINSLTGRNYQLFNYYGSPSAKYVIVAMGSVTDTIREVIHARGDEVGLVEVHLYRPFSMEHLLKSLPSTVQKIAVLDRTKEAGSHGEPLYKDVVEALQSRNISIYGGRYGLSSKNTTPAMINGVFESMIQGTIHSNFTIGICDDVTNLSLPEVPLHLSNRYIECLVWGYGSDGMVSASKDIMKITGNLTDQYVQGYFQYDSKKSGGVTKSHLRFSKDEIHAPYYVENPRLIVCTNESYLSKFAVLDTISENGIFLLNTAKTGREVSSLFTKKDLSILKERNVSVYAVDALKISESVDLDRKISSIMEVGIFKFLDLTSFDDAISSMKESVISKFSKKGNQIAEKNLQAIDMALHAFEKVDVVDVNASEEVMISDDLVVDSLNKALGDQLPVSAFMKYSDGTFPGGLSAKEKRSTSSFAPKWNPENCIQCNMCSFVCPHAVIRPFLLTKEELSNAPKIIQEQARPANILNQDLYFMLCPSVPDCTGCKLCVNICPGKKGEKALFLENVDTLKEQGYEEAWDYLINRVSHKEVLPKSTVKGSQFQKPRFEFSGACAGCGETPYLKLLTQLFGDTLVVANATGCSSIYSASLPTTAWSIPWSNSLFEDNAEYGFGMKIADSTMKNRIRSILPKYRSILGEDIVDAYLENPTVETGEALYQSVQNSSIIELLELKEFIKVRNFFLVGGDGWAYDIGFSGIDHVLSNQENVNILVLDTEVYSNTGGQSSKSSKTASVAKFTSTGKKNAKKDLAKIALTYPHAYVATVSLGANMQHTIKIFNEAANYQGPSIIIAYSPCIAQGILRGMENSIEEEKQAVLSGYFPLFHYDPRTSKFTLDSKADFDHYQEFLKGEDRYRMLSIVNPDKCEELLQENEKHARERYEYYQKLAELSNKE